MKIKTFPEISTVRIRIEQPDEDENAIQDIDLKFLTNELRRRIMNGDKFSILIVDEVGDKLTIHQKFRLAEWCAAYEERLENQIYGCAFVSRLQMIDLQAMDPVKTYFPPFPFQSFTDDMEALEWLRELKPNSAPLKPIKKIRQKRSKRLTLITDQ